MGGGEKRREGYGALPLSLRYAQRCLPLDVEVVALTEKKEQSAAVAHAQRLHAQSIKYKV